MRTGADYLESLRDGRRVMCGGELIDDLTSHPKTRGYAHEVAAFYDLHHSPERQDLLTFVDAAGVRRARYWQMPAGKADVVRRREYYEFIFRHFHGGMWSRLPCSNNTVLMMLADDPEPWQEQTVMGKGRPLAANILRAWNEMRDRDLAMAPMFIDLQYDRSSQGDERVPMLTVVEERADGIVVEGWKAVGTGSPFANWLNLGVLWNVGTQSDQVIFARVPAAAAGLTHVSRQSYAKDGANEYDYPFSSRGDELDAMAYFDHVHIPWADVFHLGNIEHAKHYPQRVFDWIHVETQIRQVVNAELLAGLAILLTESLGTARHPVVTSQVADMIRFRETCRAFMIASEDTGIVTPGGLYKPNNVFVDLARAFYIENVNKHIEVLTDLCGRGIMIQPTAEDLDDPYIGPHLADALRGRGISARDRMRIFKVIRDRFYSEGGARHEIFERFNGTPVFLIKLLTMARVEYAADGPLVELARQVCGFGDGSDLIKRAAAERERAREKAPLPEYVRRQDVDIA